MSMAAEKPLLPHRDVRKKKVNAPLWFITKSYRAAAVMNFKKPTAAALLPW
jgi:hypothetical protein